MHCIFYLPSKRSCQIWEFISKAPLPEDLQAKLERHYCRTGMHLGCPIFCRIEQLPACQRQRRRTSGSGSQTDDIDHMAPFEPPTP